MGMHESDYHEIDQSTLLLQGMVNIQAKEMIRSIGALLIFLMTYVRKDHFEHDQPSISIHSFIPLDLENYMLIDRVRLISIHAWLMMKDVSEEADSIVHSCKSWYLYDCSPSLHD